VTTITDALDAVVEAATGRPLASLTATEALDVAATLRAIVAALPPTNPRDAHLCALLTEPQPHRHHHLGRLKVHVGDGDPGQVHQALECSSGSHGIGLLGSVVFAAPNLETTRTRHVDGYRSDLVAGSPRPTGKRVRMTGTTGRTNNRCPTTRTPWSFQGDSPHSCGKTLNSSRGRSSLLVGGLPLSVEPLAFGLLIP
jgi:hypothetical protein